ncbi:hypothetical protein C8R43DRAFT_368523 [Mycena crocata]|nr:hypothetical protein C8R43DRAFT_368523 [Mycena crocata]
MLTFYEKFTILLALHLPLIISFNAVKTIKTSFMGTFNMLGLAKRTKARFLIGTTHPRCTVTPMSIHRLRNTGGMLTQLGLVLATMRGSE